MACSAAQSAQSSLSHGLPDIKIAHGRLSAPVMPSSRLQSSSSSLQIPLPKHLKRDYIHLCLSALNIHSQENTPSVFLEEFYYHDATF